jgi:AraC-like DNA-binding protein
MMNKPAGSAVLDIPSAPLPVCLEYGSARYAPGDCHPARRALGVYDLIFVQEGTLYMGEEETEWAVGPGRTVILHPERYHYAMKPCDRETFFYWLHFTPAGGSVRQLQAKPYTIQLPQYWTSPAPSLISSIFRQLLGLTSARRSEAFWKEQTLFLELLKQLDESRYQREGSRVLNVAEAVEAYIRRNYQLPLSNRHLAEELHFHYNYLSRCMKQVYGVTPMEYVMQVRLEQAKLLLLKTDWPMPRIAEEVGFESAAYFSRCFSARNGLPPLQFRKRYSG